MYAVLKVVSTLIAPQSSVFIYYSRGRVDMGVVGMKLYEQLDQLCRKMAHSACQRLGLPTKNVDNILDPVWKEGKPVVRDVNNWSSCTSAYVPPGYVSAPNPIVCLHLMKNIYPALLWTTSTTIILSKKRYKLMRNFTTTTVSYSPPLLSCIAVLVGVGTHFSEMLYVVSSCFPSLSDR